MITYGAPVRRWPARRAARAEISTPLLSAPVFSRVARSWWVGAEKLPLGAIEGDGRSAPTSRSFGKTARRRVAHQGLV